eukprot:4077171-Prymnesium_polylepis.1
MEEVSTLLSGLPTEGGDGSSGDGALASSFSFAVVSVDLLGMILEWLVEPADIAAASAVDRRFAGAMAADAGWRVRLRRAFGATAREAACAAPRRQYWRLHCRCHRIALSSGPEPDELEYDVLRSLAWLAGEPARSATLHPSPVSLATLRFHSNPLARAARAQRTRTIRPASRREHRASPRWPSSTRGASAA